MSNKISREPTHPGKFLREGFLEPHNIIQVDFANALQINRVTMSKILNGHQRITPDVAVRLSKCLNTSPDVWLNMQAKHDLWAELHDKNHIKRRLKVKSFDWIKSNLLHLKSNQLLPLKQEQLQKQVR